MRIEVPAALAGERADRVVAMASGMSRSEVAELAASGAITSGGRVVARSRRVRPGDVLEVELPVKVPEQVVSPDPHMVVPVVHADAEVIVVDKPAGLVVHPGAGNRTGTLVGGLLAAFPDLADAGPPHRPGIVHRLDKGTSGLLVVARTRLARRLLTQQLADRAVERRYLALVEGEVTSDTGVVDAPVGRSARDRTAMAVSNRGRPARTRYRVLSRYSDPFASTLLECTLETGRTHQVRVHLSAIGHALVGDTRYGAPHGVDRPRRAFLHAHRLGFDHPGSGERVRFESPVPPELEAVLDALS